MNRRLKFFLIHLVSSVGVITALVVFAWWGWYCSPNWYLTGVGYIAGMALFVDIGLGPCATFVVASKNKSWKVLRLDLFVIVVMQIIALSYAAYTVWRARPLFYVLSGNSITMIRAADVRQSGIDEALKSGNLRYLPSWSSRPTWVWAPMPENEDEVAGIIQHAVLTGEDITNRPKYFQPFADAARTLEKYLIPLKELKANKVLSGSEFENRKKSLLGAEDEFGYIFVAGPDKDGIFVFKKGEMEPRDFWPVAVPSRP